MRARGYAMKAQVQINFRPVAVRVLTRRVHLRPVCAELSDHGTIAHRAVHIYARDNRRVLRAHLETDNEVARLGQRVHQYRYVAEVKSRKVIISVRRHRDAAVIVLRGDHAAFALLSAKQLVRPGRNIVPGLKRTVEGQVHPFVYSDANAHRHVRPRRPRVRRRDTRQQRKVRLLRQPKVHHKARRIIARNQVPVTRPDPCQASGRSYLRRNKGPRVRPLLAAAPQLHRHTPHVRRLLLLQRLARRRALRLLPLRHKVVVPEQVVPQRVVNHNRVPARHQRPHVARPLRARQRHRPARHRNQHARPRVRQLRPERQIRPLARREVPPHRQLPLRSRLLRHREAPAPSRRALDSRAVHIPAPVAELFTHVPAAEAPVRSLRQHIRHQNQRRNAPVRLMLARRAVIHLRHSRARAGRHDVREQLQRREVPAHPSLCSRYHFFFLSFLVRYCHPRTISTACPACLSFQLPRP